MQKYSIWIEESRGTDELVLYHDGDEKRNVPLITFNVGKNRGAIALSNGTLLEYDTKKGTFGIILTKNCNTHIYRDGEIWALFTEDELEWALITPDESAYVWLKRD